MTVLDAMRSLEEWRKHPGRSYRIDHHNNGSITVTLTSYKSTVATGMGPTELAAVEAAMKKLEGK